MKAGDGTKHGALLAEILRAVAGIRYGSVEIIIHEGQIVQIERKEKIRFDKNISP